MRAGPLSDSTIIQTLNREFVNTWVLNKRLEALKKSVEPNARLLAHATLAARKKGSPVDSLIFTSELDMIARQPANDLLANQENAVRSYAAFLNGALAKLNR